MSIVQALLGAHASPGTVNRAGRTPEMMAIAFGQAAAVQALRAAAPAQPAAPGPGPAAPNPYPSMLGPGLSVTGSGGSGGGSAPPWGLEPALQRLSPQPQPQPTAISVPSYPGIPPPIPLDRVSPQLVLERISPQPGLPAAPQGMQRVSPLPRGPVGPSPAMSHVSLSSRTSGGAARDALCQAAEQGNVPELHSLLAAGAPLNAPDEQGETPLHHAGMLPPVHSTPSARLLELCSGVPSCVWLGAAIMKVRDNRAFYLPRWQHPLCCLPADPTLRLLVPTLAPGVCFAPAARGGQAKSVKVLVASGARISMPDNAGRTPLMVAADGGHVPALQVRAKRMCWRGQLLEPSVPSRCSKVCSA